jgi:hypothetical protein
MAAFPNRHGPAASPDSRRRTRWRRRRARRGVSPGPRRAATREPAVLGSITPWGRAPLSMVLFQLLSRRPLRPRRHNVRAGKAGAERRRGTRGRRQGRAQGRGGRERGAGGAQAGRRRRERAGWKSFDSQLGLLAFCPAPSASRGQLPARGGGPPRRKALGRPHECRCGGSGPFGNGPRQEQRAGGVDGLAASCAQAHLHRRRTRRMGRKRCGGVGR